MKKRFIIYALIIVLAGFSITACGSDDNTPAPGPTPVINTPVPDPTPTPVIINAPALISCAEVANDRYCDTVPDAAGIYNAGMIGIANWQYADYLNVDVTNPTGAPISVYVYADMHILGCSAMDRPVQSGALDLQPGETISIYAALWGYQCGVDGFNAVTVGIYNTTDSEMLSSAVVLWQATEFGY